jgi:pyruvate dehydrogenase E2 component (dihydrolipoyllysine-residue acetyltransferase)
MPSLGADMDAGAVVEWRVGPGDRVARGDIVAVVHTDKADVEIESFVAGVVEEMVVPVGTQVPVGTVLVRLLPVDGAGAPSPPPAALPPAPGPAPPRRPRASPRARRAAAREGIDLGTIAGTGPGGAVTGEDVARVAAPAAAPADERRSAMRRVIGALMARSKREIPHYYLATQIDMRRTLAWLEEENLRRPVAERLIPAALLVRAVALATRAVPEMNGHWIDDSLRLSRAVHAGVAVSLRGGGLVAPAIRDAERKGLDEVMADLADLVRRARRGTIRGSEAEPTITITNLGDRGVEAVYGVIYPPQVALVGFGAILERPWAQDGALSARPVLTATLSADHRATDGAAGGRFLGEVARLLTEPEAL